MCVDGILGDHLSLHDKDEVFMFWNCVRKTGVSFWPPGRGVGTLEAESISPSPSPLSGTLLVFSSHTPGNSPDLRPCSAPLVLPYQVGFWGLLKVLCLPSSPNPDQSPCVTGMRCYRSCLIKLIHSRIWTAFLCLSCVACILNNVFANP
jgi:hypothetical protein